MIDELYEQPLLRSAAMIAYTFKIDPLKVLDDTYENYAVRLAAANYVNDQVAEANKKAQAKKK